MESTRVRVVMTHNPSMVEPMTTLQEAARKMADLDCGVLPIGENNQVEGIITDRDIVIRAVSRGKDIAKETVQDHMTKEVLYCHEEDPLSHVANLMHQHHVNRLLVLNDSGELTGIISFGCILRKDPDSQEVSDIVERAVGRVAA